MAKGSKKRTRARIGSGSGVGAARGVGASTAAATGRSRSTVHRLKAEGIPSQSKIFPGTEVVQYPADNKRSRPKKIVIRNKRQVLIQSRILISALEEALDYRPTVGSNRSVPELRADLNLDDHQAQSEIRELVSELKKLNAFLEAAKRAMAVDRKNIIDVKKHLNTFLHSFANNFGKTTGVGAGLLTVGLAASLLYHLGAKEAVDLAMLLKAGRH
jgi:hypothetical protein